MHQSRLVIVRYAPLLLGLEPESWAVVAGTAWSFAVVIVVATAAVAFVSPLAIDGTLSLRLFKTIPFPLLL